MAKDLDRQCCRSPQAIRSIRDAKESIEIPGIDGNPEVNKRLLTSIAVSPLSGKLFISDENNGTILVFSQEREYITSFGTKGYRDGELYYPKGIAVDSEGLIYVASRLNHRIEVFREDGTFIRQIGRRQLFHPKKLVIHNQLLYISNYSGCEYRGPAYIAVYTLQGEHVFSISTPAVHLQHKEIDCMGFTPDGYLCVVQDHNRVLVLTSSGQTKREFYLGYPDFNGLYPTDMLITSEGDVLVADPLYGNCVYVFSTHDNAKTNLKPHHCIQGLLRAESVAIDKEGNILVVHLTPNRKQWRVAVF